MSVWSKHFYGPAKPSSAAVVTLYTCPAGRTALIKDLLLINMSATIAARLRLFLNVGAGTLECGRFDAAANAPSVNYPLRLVLQEGQFIAAIRDHTTQDVRATITGFEFDA